MQIWSAEIKELESLYTSLKGRFPELEKDLEHLIKTDDENVALLYSRRCLEIIVTDLCESELKRPRKTEPLRGIIDKLHKEEKVPAHIITSMESLNSLSTYGTHPKEFDPEQVRPILLNLATIIKWYVKYKDTQIISQAKPEEAKYESKEPVDTREGIRKPKRKLIILLSGLLVVIIVVALFVFNILGGEKQTKEVDKSIAVLPFHNDSPDEGNTYFIDGMMETILDNLCKIQDLTVIARTSVEQYRNLPKQVTEIAKELNVNYLLEGSGQKYEDKIRLTVQLINGKNGKHIWSNQYNRELKDIFSVQSEISQLIADELKAIITPEEKQLIEKIPTTSLTAFDFYQRGREVHTKYLIDFNYQMDNNKREALEKADYFYHEALNYDPSFAQAYTGLALTYRYRHYWESYFSENILDSVLILCDIALSYDNQLSEAYTTRGDYYRALNKPEKALEEYGKALKLNPNDWMAYSGKGELNSNYNLVESINNYNKATSLNRGEQLPSLLRSLGYVYMNAGFMEKSKYYSQEAFKLDQDSMAYYTYLNIIESFSDNQEKAIEFLKKSYKIDSNNMDVIFDIGQGYEFLGKYEISLKYFKKWLERTKNISANSLFGLHRIGLAYWNCGYKQEAEFYFNEQVNYCNRMIELGRINGEYIRVFYDLAGAYAFRGQKEKAYENLRIFNQIEIGGLWMVWYLKNDPLFDSIRNEPEFQQILAEMEAKYQAEHERVRKWMEEQGEI